MGSAKWAVLRILAVKIRVLCMFNSKLCFMLISAKWRSGGKFCILTCKSVYFDASLHQSLGQFNVAGTASSQFL